MTTLKTGDTVGRASLSMTVMEVGVAVPPSAGAPVRDVSRKGPAMPPIGTILPIRVPPTGTIAGIAGPTPPIGTTVDTVTGTRIIVIAPGIQVLLLLRRILRGLRRGAVIPSPGTTIPPTMKVPARVSRDRVLRFAARSPGGGVMPRPTLDNRGRTWIRATSRI